MKVITYTFKDGSIVHGTINELKAIAKIKGEPFMEVPVGYYQSESKGIVEIAKMNEYHIKNAITKIARDYYQRLGKEDISIEDYLRKFVKLVEEPKLGELFSELQRRVGMEVLAKTK